MGIDITNPAKTAEDIANFRMIHHHVCQSGQ